MSSIEELELSLTEYELQIYQIEEAILGSTNDDEKINLKSLKNDLLELVNLTKETLAHQSSAAPPQNQNNDKIEDELDLFYKDLKEESTDTPEEKIYVDKELKEELKNLIGMKCTAPYSCSMYGSKTHHNAFICSVDEKETESLNKLMVRIFYINPVQSNMIPCSYFLDNTCKFDAEKCRHSHGESVAFDDLKDYKKPDFKLLSPKCLVLVKDKNLWVRGVVQTVNIEERSCNVKIDQTKKEVDKEFEDLFPLEGDENSDLDSDSDSSDFEETPDNQINFLNFQNLFHPDSGENLGDFEKYTRGIGSKLMEKMGYIPGSGLGKSGQGIIIPVSAQILPQGSSLDYCMSLREAANGDKDFFTVEKKLKRLKKKQERINQINYERSKKASESNVFNFINQKVFSNQEKDQPSTSGYVKPNLKDHCNKKLNLANFQLSENIRKTEKDLEALKNNLKRHKPETEIYKNLNQKIVAKSNELSSLKISEKRVIDEQNSRKNKNKLTIF